jgi:hypothetical protein
VVVVIVLLLLVLVVVVRAALTNGRLIISNITFLSIRPKRGNKDNTCDDDAHLSTER